MSEQQFDPLAQAKQDADPMKHRYSQWVGNPAEVTQEGAADMVAYLESRPYEDPNGAIHDPETGKFISGDKHFDDARTTHEEASSKETDYDGMSMVQLAKKLGQAELDQDKTTQDNVLDSLLSKIDEHVAKSDESSSNREEAMFDKDGNPVDMHGIWLDKMLKTKDAYKAEKLEPAKSEKVGAEYKPGDRVTVHRTGGDIEDNWEVAGIVEKNGVKYAVVRAEDPDRPGGVLEKDVRLDELSEWQERAAEQEAIKENVKLNIKKSEDVRAARKEAQERNQDKVPGTDLVLYEGERQEGGHVKSVFARAKDKLGKLWAGAGVAAGVAVAKTKEYFTNEEKGKRRTIIAAAAGAVAVGVAGYLLYKGVGSGGDGSGPKNNNRPDLSGTGSPGKGGDTSGEVVSSAINPNQAPAHIDTAGYDYPWNWAESKYGQGNGSGAMKSLAEQARMSGHQVQWFNGNSPIPPELVNANSWVQIDGVSDTDSVVNILGNL